MPEKIGGERGQTIEWEELHSIVARVPRQAAERASGRAAAMRGRELHHAVARMRRAAGCNRRKGDWGANEARRDGGAQDGSSVSNAAHVHGGVIVGERQLSNCEFHPCRE